MRRAELLAELFNAAPLQHRRRRHQRQVDDDGDDRLDPAPAGRDPTIMNGAVMKNFVTPDDAVRQRAGRRGRRLRQRSRRKRRLDRAVSVRSVAVVNNISLDHKTMDELRTLFRDFVAKAKVAVLNLDNDETRGAGRDAAVATTIDVTA